MSIVLIFHYTRCGSTVVSDILDRLSSVTHFGELLNPNNGWPRRLNRLDFNAGDGAMNSPSDVAMLLRSGIGVRRGDSVERRVFFELTTWDFHRKVITGQISDFCHAASLFFNDGFLVIQLIRKNAFRRFLSSELAEMSGVYHSTSSMVERRKICIDTEKMIRNIKVHQYLYQEHSEQFGRIWGSRFMSMSYELDIETDPVRGARRMMEFSGAITNEEDLALKGISPRLQRVSSGGLDSLIDNIDEVKLALEDNGFGWMAY